MAYDEGLAERLRGIFEEQPGAAEKRMFGGLAFLLHGKMCCGVVGDELMVRVGPERHAEALARPHARPMDFTGRPMKGFVFVSQDGLDSDRELEWWVKLSVGAARAAAAEKKKAPKRARRLQ